MEKYELEPEKEEEAGVVDEASDETEDAEMPDEEADDTEDAPSFSEEDEHIESIGEDFDGALEQKKKKRKKRLIIFGIIAGIIVVLIAVSAISGSIKSKNALKNMYTDAPVERRTITNSITGSSKIDPNDSYNVMTIKSGDITADYFKEGDTVKKGDKLYQFEDDEARRTLTSAKNALTKAEQSYVDAVKQKAQTVSSNNLSSKSAQNSVTKALQALNDAQKSYGDQYIRSDISGKIKSVSISEGDTVNNGTQVAEVFDDSVMKIRVPFNEFDAESVYVGASAEVTVVGSLDTIYGTVTEKSSGSTATSAHAIVVYATIEVANPGALTENDIGSAVVNGVACADTAKFECASTRKITAEVSGKVKNVSVSVGDGVYSGQQIAYVESDSANTSLKNAELSYDDAVLALQKQVLQNDTYAQDSGIKNAQLALDDARVSLEKAQDAVDDYLIEAPIEGTVVKKNAKSGDTIDSSNGSDALCVIYDLSSVKLSIDVDETEIAQVKTGQTATITADAVEGEFTGTITKVPVDGVNENGVTTYTIEIEVQEYGDLLPGMNVDAEIIVEEAQNVLAVPVNSVNRGNIVFVKDDGTKRENDVTDIISGNKDKNSDEKNGEKNTDGKGEEKDVKASALPKARGNNENNAALGKEYSGARPENGGGQKQGGSMPVVSSPKPSSTEKPSSKGIDVSSIPTNIEIPEGYRAIAVETGINDTEYIEIKSGLTENDTVRTLNTNASSADASFGNGEDMYVMPNGGMSGGMSGGPGGGSMGGGGMPAGGHGSGSMGGGMR